ncbi:hypothetical protein C1X73_35970, partial [Pseudomonas sp. FW305-130]
FSHGLAVPMLGATGRIATDLQMTALAALPPLRPTAIRALPAVAEWHNVRDLGARGDAMTDDTAALQRAIDTQRVLYFPVGFYRVTNTLK